MLWIFYAVVAQRIHGLLILSITSFCQLLTLSYLAFCLYPTHWLPLALTDPSYDRLLKKATRLRVIGHILVDNDATSNDSSDAEESKSQHLLQGEVAAAAN